MNDLKEALQYVAGLANEAEVTEVVDICGKTYANRKLTRYDQEAKAEAVVASTLTSMVDYIRSCHGEFSSDMIIHIVSPTKVRLMSALDKERGREVLFETRAETSEFKFDREYDQERFIIELQANFVSSDDLELVMKVAGNVEAESTANYGDDGMTQKTTIKQGIASKVDTIVPNPVVLIPYRTFQEIDQPASNFVFRISGKRDPEFKLIEAGGGIWKNEAIKNIKQFFKDNLKGSAVAENMTIIG